MNPRGRYRLSVRLVGCLAMLLAAPGPAVAARVSHVLRSGETIESLATLYYGKSTLAPLVREANGLDKDARPPTGKKLHLPSATWYQTRAGDTLEKLAIQRLGDVRRVRFLAEWNGLQPNAPLRPGMKIKLPDVLSRRASLPESFSTLAEKIYGDKTLGKMLQTYNFRDKALVGPGERVLLPVLITASRPPADGGARTGRPPEDTRLKERQAAVDRRLNEIAASYRDGNYADVPPALIRLLAEGSCTDEQLVAIHRLLAFAYVALGTNELALREFREVLSQAPETRLDQATVSPKIRAVFERARQSR